MTTEDDFQAALDAHPDDWQTRLVFADWLDERGDPRAAGYRALGVLRRRPQFDTAPDVYWYFANDRTDRHQYADPLHERRALIPTDWFRLAAPGRDFWTSGFDTRRAAEDAAAEAFARLPASRRAELLATEVLA